MWLLVLLFASLLSDVHSQPSPVDRAPVSPSGFLADVIPLEVVTIIPNALVSTTRSRPILVEGQQTLTVVFSRPVIALGSDFGFENLPNELVPFTLDPPIPGRGRWVTTFIYRFDTDGPFATDLSLTFIWNLNLMTYDGVQLTLDSPTEVALRTPSLSFDIRTVVSEQATNFTDGGWGPFGGLRDDILPEVPPDGFVELRFTAPVSLEVLSENLEVVERTNESEDVNRRFSETEIKVVVNECPFFSASEDGESRCANVSFVGDLSIGTRYALRLSAGVDYGRASGPLRSTIRKSFGGLRRFRIPFVEIRLPLYTTPFFDIELPHGLAIGTVIREIPISMEDGDGEPVPFNLTRPSINMLRILTSILPRKKFKISVESSDSITDGFGLPLEASEITFETDRVASDFERFNSGSFDRYGVFEAGQDWGRQMLAFTKGKRRQGSRNCPNGFLVDLWSIENPASVIVIANGGSSDGSFERFLGPPDDQLELIKVDNISQIASRDLTPLLEPTGIIAAQDCSFGFYRPDVFVETTIQVTVIINSGARFPKPVTIWVTSMETGAPVPGATVELYLDSRPFGNPRLVGEGTTNEDGVASVDGVTNQRILAVVVRTEGTRLMYLPDIRVASFFQESITSELVLDRLLVIPGEVFHVKGYVLSRSGARFVPTTALSDPAITLSPEISGIGSIPVVIDDEFGSFEVLVSVPENATNQNYRVQFVGVRRNGNRFFGNSATVTVGQPRLPTVDLAVDTPFFVRPTERIPVSVTIESFIGSAVGGQEVEVSWTIAVTGRDDPSGEFTITTVSNGTGTGFIDLSLLDPAPPLRSRVSIDFAYVGPTGELIEQSATVRIEAANIDLQIRRTVSTDFPMQTFGVWVIAEDLRGRPLRGGDRVSTATISLHEAPQNTGANIPRTSSTPLETPIIDQCTFSFEENEFCDFALPRNARFVLEACVTQEIVFCSRVVVGRIRDPTSRFIPIGFTDRTDRRLETGEDKEILVENPYLNAYAYLTWGTRETVRNRVFPLPKGRTTVAIEVQELCQFDCEFRLVVSIPRQTEGLATNLSVPVSRLFDPAMPHLESFQNPILGVPTIPTRLDISLSVPGTREEEDGNTIAPGETTTVDVELNDSESRTEVTVVIVNKAILELISNPLEDLSRKFRPDLSTDFSLSYSTDNLIAPGVIGELVRYYESRRRLNPWFSLANSAFFRFQVDQTESEFIESTAETITVATFARDFFRPRIARRFSTFSFSSASASPVELSATVPEEAFGQVASAAAVIGEGSADTVAMLGESAPSSDDSLRFESEFENVPLFDTEVTEDGMLRFNFTAPPNLGTFVIRAYATSNTGIFGSSETEVIVRRDISLTPSIPRFARVGDRFEAGAVVTVSGISVTPIFLEAEIEGPLEFVGEDILEVEVGADGQEEARFVLRAIAVGMANFTLTATDEFGNMDAVQVELEIMGLQEPVTVGTSFNIEGEDTQTFVEGIALPAAVPGSGDILITAGVGRQPSVLSLAEQILRVRNPFDCPVSGDFALASVSIPAILDPYDPWNNAAFGDDLVDLIDLVLSRFEEAVPFISIGGGLTTPELGFLPFTQCPDSRIRQNPRPSFFQNAKGVFIVNFVMQILVSHSLPEVRSQASTILDAVDVWRTVLGMEFENLAIESRESRTFSSPLSISTVAFGRAALGPDWQPETTNDTIVDDLSMDRLSRSFDDLSVESQAYYILARLSEPDGTNHPDVALAIDTWTDLLRITGRTAYIAAFTGSATPASDLANALVFLARLRAGEEGQLLPRLGSYIASPTSDLYGFRTFGTYPMLVTMQALVEFDVSRGSAQPDLQFDAVSGNVTLLSATFNESSSPVATGRVLWDDLPDDPEPIEVAAVGSGEASVSITLNFIPAELLPFPTYRGIFVERSIQLEGAEDGDGPSLTVVPRGSTVTVKVQFLTPDSLGQTVVRVPMPAGLEPVDPNISGDSNFCPVPFFRLFSSFFFPRCPDQETRPSVVTFTFDSVREGTSSVSFRAVAATTGVYTLPPARVFVVDQPEVMGLSSAGSFEVCTGSECAPQFADPSAPPINCPDDCNGSGSCNLQEGTCLCFPGFTGEACELLT